MAKIMNLKLSSAGRCFYYLSNGLVLFAEHDAVTTVDDCYSFDVTQTVVIMYNTNPPTKNPGLNVFPGAPTFYLARKSDVRGMTDCTDEALLLELRAIRSGLTLGPGVLRAAERMPGEPE